MYLFPMNLALPPVIQKGRWMRAKVKAKPIVRLLAAVRQLKGTQPY